jgi:hypothetical protein
VPSDWACCSVKALRGEPCSVQMLAYLAADLAGRTRKMMPCRISHQMGLGISTTRLSPKNSAKYLRRAGAVGALGVPKLQYSTAVRAA